MSTENRPMRDVHDHWRRHVLLVVAAILLLSPTPSAPAAAPVTQPGPTLGGLLVAPTRVVFEGRRRSAQLTLVNRGAAPATYRISFIQMKMRPDGGFETIDEPVPGAPPSDSLVRYSPRQVELAPGESQTVRLMVRKPGDLPSGEYRSHLLLRAIPPVDASPLEARDERSVGVRLIPVYGVSVPVILRQGETTATLTLGGLELVPGERPSLRLILQRAGTRSVYGDLIVDWLPRRGSRREVGRLRKVAVYTPNAEREVTLPLEVEPRALAAGRLEVRFESGEEGASMGEELARTSVEVQ
ncbi:MAG TPA: fimbria/pilus periplasmic chaperone [Thermoanaerobaculia bacterium]|nr:fimbria/pilus periplasmic chaperone [Thermoanaerobaculia bacterium]